MWTLTIALIACTIIWRYIATDKLRNMLMPWALAVVILNATCAQFYFGALHAMLALLNYSAWIICIDGFNCGRYSRNRIWSVFLMFWGYMMISSFMGYHAFQGMASFLNALIVSFCVGYYLSVLVCRIEGGVSRVNLAITCASLIIGYLYMKYGAFTSMEVLQESRVVFDEERFLRDDMVNNVNRTALCMCAVLPFLLVAAFGIAFTRVQRIIKWFSIAGFVLCLVTLIKTGARNGGVALIPMGLYLLSSTRNRSKRWKKYLLIGCTFITCVVGVRYVMRGSENIRALEFFSSDGGIGMKSLDEISSGRIGWWVAEFNSMTTTEVFLGRGFEKSALNERGRAMLMNYHSIYMFVFLHGGLVGLFLMMFFFGVFWVVAHRKGERGKMAMMFMGVWALGGIGEAAGITGGVTGILAGFAMGLCSDNPIKNTELMNEDERRRLLFGYCGEGR